MDLTRRATLLTSAALATSVLHPERAFAQETPRRGGIMSVHFATEQRILNPSLQASTGVYIVGGKIQEPLVDLDANGNPAPCLAESWQATPDGKNPQMRPFMSGFLDKAKNNFWGRPVDVMVMPDGSLLVSDEENGAIYRVSYKR